MPDTIRVNESIIPYVAHAMAMLPGCRDRLDSIYQQRRAVYHSAAQKSPFKNAKIIAKGRAEHQVMGMRILGMFQYAFENKDEPLLKRIMRAADANMYDTLTRLNATPDGHLTAKLLRVQDPDATDSMVTWRTLLLFFMCETLDIPHNEAVAKAVREHVEHTVLMSVDPISPHPEQLKRAQEIQKKYKTIDTDALYDMAHDILSDDDLAKLDYLYFLIETAANIDLSDYAADIALDKRSFAMCLMRNDPVREIERATLMCVMLAAKRDREFCLKLYREDKTLDYETAAAQRDYANARAISAEERAAKAEKALLALQAERKDSAAEELSRRCDALQQEITALRTALYDAQTPEETQPTEPQRRRTIPEHIVCVGGHATWAKRMQEIFPQAAFYPIDVSVPMDAIRSADELWFQPLYMAHKQFAPVIDEARRCGIPIRYFPSTGVERCAEELRK